MLRIVSADKFISSRFILEYSKVEFASLLGVSVAKITNIESGKSTIPPVYDYAINHLLSSHPFRDSAIAALCSHDTLNFARRVDVNSKVKRLSCKRCDSRKLHVMAGMSGLYFVECLDCKHTMYSSGVAVKRYQQWANNGVRLDSYLFS
ncbi:XRE family transcriptional regulator [Vibrio sp. CAU 1672]|uniref:XRE family transcriptional regulator n=1 Tax=Vibrio sp. CAU 1672 TaxID=3032594 RepID=UPI0023DC28B8|nr:XRE family transcriptional regulator [Vibrio sp. CAU 1672]MDF2153057.1 XRE family transcriptional regulator [Vibrio sp. CAU 1672]